MNKLKKLTETDYAPFRFILNNCCQSRIQHTQPQNPKEFTKWISTFDESTEFFLYCSIDHKPVGFAMLEHTEALTWLNCGIAQSFKKTGDWHKQLIQDIIFRYAQHTLRIKLPIHNQLEFDLYVQAGFKLVYSGLTMVELERCPVGTKKQKID